jgi:hypothetical protein
MKKHGDGWRFAVLARPEHFHSITKQRHADATHLAVGCFDRRVGAAIGAVFFYISTTTVRRRHRRQRIARIGAFLRLVNRHHGIVEQLNAELIA